MNLTLNFTLDEFTQSATAKINKIENKPTPKQVEALRTLCDNILQPARNFIGQITILSGFRSVALNAKLKGAKNSQHTRGEAADIDSRDNARLFSYLQGRQNFDQLIWEFGDENQPGWIHVSVKESENRKEVLRAVKEGEKTVYKPFV